MYKTFIVYEHILTCYPLIFTSDPKRRGGRAQNDLVGDFVGLPEDSYTLSQDDEPFDSPDQHVKNEDDV